MTLQAANGNQTEAPIVQENTPTVGTTTISTTTSAPSSPTTAAPTSAAPASPATEAPPSGVAEESQQSNNTASAGVEVATVLTFLGVVNGHRVTTPAGKTHFRY